MKKRHLLLGILILACSINLLACGQNKIEVPSVKETENTSEDLLENSQSDIETEQEEYDIAEMKMPEISITKETRDWKQEDEVWLIHAEYECASLEGDIYSDAAQTLEEWCEEQVEGVESQAEEMLEYEVYTDDIRDSYAFSIFQNLEVKRADDNVISILSSNSSYTGGAHGYYDYFALSIDTQTGKRLEFKDFIKEDSIDDFYEMMISYLSEQLILEYEEGLYLDYQDILETLLEENTAVWYFDGSGIGFVFAPYLIGPYAMGTAHANLPYVEFKEYLKEDYKHILQVNNVSFLPDVDMYLSLGDDAQELTRLCVKTTRETEDSDLQVTLECGDSKLEIGTFASVTENYFLKTTDDRSFLILCMDYASEDYVTFLYEVTNGVLKESDEVGDLELDSVVSADKLYFRKRLDVLGTYMAKTSYYINEKGKLVQSEDIFQIDPEIYSWNLLTTVKELPVFVDGEEILLPVGTKIRIEATDNQGLVYIQVEDTGVQGTISYTRDEEESWIIYIDGVSEYEYFEQLPYAG